MLNRLKLRDVIQPGVTKGHDNFISYLQLLSAETTSPDFECSVLFIGHKLQFVYAGSFRLKFAGLK